MMKIEITLANGIKLSSAVMPNADVKQWVSDCQASGSWGKNPTIVITDITADTDAAALALKVKRDAATATISAFDPATIKMSDVVNAVNAMAVLQGLK